MNRLFPPIPFSSRRPRRSGGRVKHAGVAVILAVIAVAACSSPGQRSYAGGQDRVPATAPNFQPPELDDGLVPDSNGDQVSTTVLSVYFEADATQAERQAAIDLAQGTVIGGVNLEGVGWYYVRVAGNGTIDRTFELAHLLDALPQVFLASPYTRFGVEPDL